MVVRRYRDPHDGDHLRLRIRSPDSTPAATIAAITDWAQHLRYNGVISRLVFDTYCPELGRYGTGAALEAAEAVFVTDSQLVSAQLRAQVEHPQTLAVINMVDIARGFLGHETAHQWLVNHPTDPPQSTLDRQVAERAIRLAQHTLPELDQCPASVADAWQQRATALAAYRTRLTDEDNPSAVLESMLHMHHNRALGIDPASEHLCRTLARRAALSWTAQHRDCPQ